MIVKMIKTYLWGLASNSGSYSLDLGLLEGLAARGFGRTGMGEDVGILGFSTEGIGGEIGWEGGVEVVGEVPICSPPGISLSPASITNWLLFSCKTMLWSWKNIKEIPVHNFNFIRLFIFNYIEQPMQIHKTFYNTTNVTLTYC